ncbi:hypothetical protein [Actinokineospora globicatena]|uniref:Uncharacterized protein n=1 Tax=Actinokineospora globicatena TaxID=103729 RepID=A0A9W6QKA1_9PSEU|nr:hypothetical protein [Actinokineospora globicatena]MCP2302501.1 hypothetical protein [Actinokineospora globicatena]GLW75814.1 hypothetical protein Aglo01_02960 [Actinokineospora globicatena]GLW82652.1 hypothetical protein Aglo02_02930 [Actinokineospora globicatena]GLW91601.1 hypothetical protein Aglo03_24170 [Actinokineospora globicatena]
MTAIDLPTPPAPPVCDEPEFAALLAGAVADEAPRLFAVIEEFGERVDARIAAWGMAFAERTELVATHRSIRMSLRDPESALALFTKPEQVRARLIWVDPDAATDET